MKKTICGILVGMVMLVTVACGASGPKGTYSDTMGGMITVTFSKKNVILAMDDVESKGTFTMDGNTINCSFSDGTTTFTYNADSNTLEYMGGLITLKHK